MRKIHVILPPGCDPDCNAIFKSALDDFSAAAFPHAEVVIYKGDNDYERAKNPLWGREAPVYIPSPVGSEPDGTPPPDLGWKS